MVKIKPVAYKATLKTIKSYEKQYKAGKVLKSGTIESYKKSISRYIDKKTGTLKAGLTERQIANFNKKVETFKSNKFSDVSEIKKSTKKAENTLLENHAGLTKAGAKGIRQMFVEANSKKVKIDSDKIIELAYEMEENKGVSNAEYEKIFKEYLKRIDKGVPFEAQAYVGTDDVVKIVQELTQIIESLETTADKNKFYRLIRQDKTIDEIREYFKTEGIKKAEPVKVKRGTIAITRQKETLAGRVKKSPVKTSKGKLAITEKKKGKKSFNGVVR